MRTFLLVTIFAALPLITISQIPRFKIAIERDTLINGDSVIFYDETLVGFPTDGTEGVDRVYDAIKLFGNTRLQVYTILNGAPYTIQAWPPIDKVRFMEVGYLTNEPGNFTFQVVQREVDKTFSIWVMDHFTNTLANLDTAGYLFNTGNVDKVNRFTVFVTEAGTDVNLWNGVVWSKGDLPDSTQYAYLRANFNTAANGEFSCLDLEIGGGDTLVVAQQHTLKVLSRLHNRGDVLVSSGGNLLTYDQGEFLGRDVYVARNTRFSGEQYSFVGSPVEMNTSILGNSLGDPVWGYDETADFGTDEGLARWVNVMDSVIRPGVGYAQARKDTLLFKGKPNTGTIEVAGTYTETGDDDTDGWFLTANPYPMAIVADSFLTTNGLSAIYFWDDNGSNQERGSNADYVVAGLLGTVGSDSRAGNGNRFNGNIGACQGFFVQLSSNDTTITYEESMRSIGNNSDDNFFRTLDKIEKIKLQLSGDNRVSESLVGFVQDGDFGIDRYDATHLATGEFSIKTLSTVGRTLAIQGLPLLNGSSMRVPVSVSLGDEKNAMLSIHPANIKGYDYYAVSWTDPFSRTRIFADEPVEVSGSFDLVLHPSKPSPSKVVDVQILVNDQVMTIKVPTEYQTFRYTITTLSGQKIVRDISSSNRAELELMDGVYIVSLQFGDKSYSTKVLMR